MALTLVVRSASDKELGLTLDAPRVVIGRGEGCELRLPDASVSHRHASIRQKGGDYVIVDEGSTNGTYLDRSRLPPQTPRPVRSGDVVRLGRVFLEVRIEASPPTSRAAQAAKELALELVERGLATGEEEPWPRITIVDGPDRGRALVLKEVGRDYTIGRAKDCDLELEGSDVARKHLRLRRKGDAIVVEAGAAGASIDGTALGDRETMWRPKQELALLGRVFAFEYPALEALVEIEKGPDERMRGDEAPETPAAPAAAEEAREEAPEEPAAPAAPAPKAAPLAKKKAPQGGWGALDGMVIVLALGVLLASLAGGYWLLGR